MSDLDVKRIAKLAGLSLESEEEARSFEHELATIFGHIEALKALPIADVPATAQVIPTKNVARTDVVTPSLDREVVLAQAPSRDGVYFRVPQILGAA